MRKSRAEALRTDPANWRLGVVYYCPEDSRVVVRQRFPVGWTWNFAHPRVIPTLGLAVLVFVGPVLLAWERGVRSPLALGGLAVAGLGAVVVAASRLARDPEAE